MRRFFIVSDIEWDTEEALPEDKEVIEALPKEIGCVAGDDDIQVWEEEEYEEDDIYDYIVEYLTDKYEWCLANYSIEEVTEEEYSNRFNA